MDVLFIEAKESVGVFLKFWWHGKKKEKKEHHKRKTSVTGFLSIRFVD